MVLEVCSATGQEEGDLGGGKARQRKYVQQRNSFSCFL